MGNNAKRALLILAIVVVAVEGYFVYRYYATSYGPAGSGVSEAANETEGTALAPEITNGAEGPSIVSTFVHRATPENSRGDYTYLDDPHTNGDPDAVLLVTPVRNPREAAFNNGHNVGVWYEPVRRKWAIFNQDRAAITDGAAFNVVVVEGPQRFVHRASLVNTVANRTYLDRPLTNENPDAILLVTQNWNPGGRGGIYNDHPVGIRYDEDVGKWEIYNQDRAPMPQDASFNVAVSNGVRATN